MADKKPIRNTSNPREHPSGVDRWTSNGLGIIMAPPTDEQRARIEALNRELDGTKEGGVSNALSKVRKRKRADQHLSGTERQQDGH